MLLQTIKSAQLAARKARKADDAAVLTTLIGDIETRSKNEGRELNETEVIKLVKKFIDNAKEMAQAYGDRRDAESSDKAWAEAELLSQFLPKQLTEDELRAEIQKIVAELDELGNKNIKIGDVVGSLKLSHAGLYDGGVATRIIKEYVK